MSCRTIIALAVAVGDVGLDRLSAVVFGHAVGQHEVDAERLVADQSPDLGQFLVDLVGEAPCRAVHAEPAGIGDGGDRGDVVSEPKDRVLDAESPTQIRRQSRVGSCAWSVRRRRIATNRYRGIRAE